MTRRQIAKPKYSIIWQRHAPTCNVFARSGITNEIAGTAQHVQAESYSQYEDSSNSDILNLEAYKNIFCDNQ